MGLWNLKLKMNWIAACLSLFTLVMSPVAMGREAEKISKQQVVNALVQMGLHKQITVGEFYQNTKHLYPQRIRSQIEPVMTRYKNVLMPKFEVTSVKGTDGIEIPNVRITQNGQLLNVQWFGDKDKYVKFQNTNLTEIDLINFNDMFDRIIAGDQVLRKQTEVKPPVAASKVFNSYPKITKALWKAMTPQERAQYMIHMRLLWSDAKKVLTEIQKEKVKPKKTSALEGILKFLIPNVDAKPTEKSATDRRVDTRARGTKVFAAAEDVSSNDCLVAGYVTSYSSTVCDHKNIKAEYREIDIVKRANTFCGESKLACNPIVFGTPRGEPICITPGRSASFQVATHFNGPCETINGTGNNHLGNEVQFLKDPNKKSGRYAPENMLDVNLEADTKKMQEPSFAQTESFLEGMLKFSGKSLYTNGIIDDATLDEVIKIKNQFDSDIAHATASCKASSDRRNSHETNFWQACDQLQRRFLFVAEFFQNKCPAGATIDRSTLKCACPAPATGVSVSPGDQCKAPPAPEPPVATEPPAAEPPTKAPSDGAELCDNGKPGKLITGVEGAAYTQCSDGRKMPEKKEPSFWEKLWKGIKVVAPFAFAGVAIWAMYKLFSPKMPKLNAAGDKCPNGTTPPCGQTCVSPQSMLSTGICGCASCPPGQTITNVAACTCGTSSTTTGSLYTCWDNVTKVDDLSKCPAQQFTCWDGSKVTNPINCPEQAPTVDTKTGIQR
ncbi:MAG: hypothetical protein A2622_12240 [Bdellovibrionales bacterium RIFCSPHIGHO2_01_FULL_40_29]|nr:MAG: hypothetical protein A2622_12240 [Bdellovibrionales bacterium RIFCSPHIGHO2_01_FULL_40_29]OFZ32957.1 MAG: hypothetical protein A3D17_09545 [Bdellovibrionales bacterium RIFCSPHIGHO2_02_FULL_40_15]